MSSDQPDDTSDARHGREKGHVDGVMKSGLDGHSYMKGYPGRVGPPRLTVVSNHGETEVEAVDSPLELVSGELLRVLTDSVLFLTQRRVQGQSGVLPLIAVSATGVHLIEPRSWPGKRVRATRDGSDFVIDRVTVPHVAAQMSEACDALASVLSTGPHPEVTMWSSWCLTAGHLPPTRLEVDGVPVLTIRGLIRRLRQSGPYDEQARERIHVDLSRRLVRV